MRKLLILNGMSPGGRIFRKLSPLLPNHAIVEWIPPGGAISVADYARMLVDELEIDAPCDVLGVSFGGIVAQELAPLVGAELCFVVSSIGSSSELTNINRFFSRVPNPLLDRMLNSVGDIAHYLPDRSSAATVRARKFAGDDGPWFRWATTAALRWNPQHSASGNSVVRIHGDRDKTFPRGHESADHVIRDADHLLVISHAEALAKIIAEHRNGKSNKRCSKS